MSWLAASGRSPAAPLRLFCLPYAGGGASAWREWPKKLGPQVDVCAVQPPGRENRWREKPFTRCEELVTAMAEALRGQLDRPYVLFGHSVGAMVACALARRFRELNLPAPRKVIVSARQAPHLPNRASTHALANEAFVEEIRKLGGLPEAVLANRELLELVLPTLRADVELDERCTIAPEPPLDVPLTVFGGRADPESHVEGLQAWAAHSRRFEGVRLFEGDHFFIHSAQEQVLGAIRELVQ